MTTRTAEFPAEGLRERHRRRRAAVIEEVALRLFEERGFDDVTVDDIAVAAGMSRRTFFRYFASKEDVVLADHHQRLTELRKALTDRPADEPALTALRQAILSMADSDEADRERLLRRAKVMRSVPSLQARSLGLQRYWEQAVTDMVAAHLGVDPAVDLRPKVVASTTLAALRAAMDTWVASAGKSDLRALATEALDLLDGGLQRSVTKPQTRRPPRRGTEIVL